MSKRSKTLMNFGPRSIKSSKDNYDTDEIIDYHSVSAKKNTLKKKLTKLFRDSKYNLILAMINAENAIAKIFKISLKSILNILGFSILLVIKYIISSYDAEIKMNWAWQITIFLINIYFFIDFAFRIYAAKNWKRHLFSGDAIIDISSIFPYFIIRFVSSDIIFRNGEDDINADLAELFCILRIMKLEPCFLFMESEINRQFSSIIIVITALIIGCACFLQFIERSQKPGDTDLLELHNFSLQFDYYLYFVMTIMSTAGYENPFKRPIMKVVIIFLIIFALYIIPKKSSLLITLISSKSMYARKIYKIVEDTPHIVIIGTVSTIAAADFFQEFFHEDHGNQPRHACLLINHRPDLHMENLIRIPAISSNVFYIQGDPLKEKDLKRCQVERAKAVIILCDKQSGDANKEDSNTILKAMMIKKYLDKSSPVKICMEILRPEGKTHYYLSLNKQTKADQVVCVDELKLSLLAKSCLCPGLVAMISNLITSSGEPKADLESKWLEEYWKGKRFEIYKTSLSSKFFGKTFSWAAANIYRNFKAILIALEINSKENSRIFPNPGDFILPVNKKMTGYIIAEDKSVADQISSYKMTEHDKFLMKQKTLNSRKSFPLQHGGSFWNSTGVNAEEDDEDRELAGKTQERINSYTSEWSKIEEKCHISKSKINLQDINFTTMENNILATNHIILCGLVPNLINFVMPLRAKYLVKYPPIVILHAKEPSEKEWNQISYFPELYYVKGSAMSLKDLFRANIMKAGKVVILAPNVEEIKLRGGEEVENKEDEEEVINNYVKLTRDEEDLLDARTIFKYKTVKKIRKDIPIVTELVCPQNLVFLLPHPKDYALMKRYGYAQTPTFASGEIYFSSVIDSLICQAYYNSSLITVLNQLLVGNINQTSNKKKDDFSEIKTSNLYHLPVPRAFKNQPFDKLFNYLTKHQNILPLGLYRLPGCTDNKYPYVCTNPDANRILSEKDMIFVLAQSPPSASSAEWGAPFEKLEEKQNIKFNNATFSEDLIVNYEDFDKDVNKTRSLHEENKKVFEGISKIIEDLKDIRQETDQLYERLNHRHNGILEKVQQSISDTIKELKEQIPETGNLNTIVYDDEDMKTGSSPSSIDENCNEEEMEMEQEKYK